MIENVLISVLHMIENLIQNYFPSTQKYLYILLISTVTSDNFDATLIPFLLE